MSFRLEWKKARAAISAVSLTFEMPEYEAVMIYCYKGTLARHWTTVRNYRLEDGGALKLTGRFDKSGLVVFGRDGCGGRLYRLFITSNALKRNNSR